MDKSEKLFQLKECISKIDEDLKNSGSYSTETFMYRNILECLKYISGILEETITENSVKTSESKKHFFITDEQRLQLKTIKNAKISDIVNELNRFTQKNNTYKIKSVWITDWLLDIGLLKLNIHYARIPSESGHTLGITTDTYNKIPINYYSIKAQQFIYDNINNIISFHYNSNEINSVISSNSESSTEKSENQFFITNKQRSQLKIMKKATESTMVSEINRVTQCNNTEKIFESWITGWLLDKKFLKLNIYHEKISSKSGHELGITAISNGFEFPRRYYSEKAQQFIYDNIDNIVTFHYIKSKQTKKTP